jgi:hypothetical protein
MNPRATLSGLLSVLLIGLPIYLYHLADSQPDDDRLFWEGVFFWALGLIFLFARRFADRVYVLRALDYAFTQFAVVGGKYRTRIYGTAFCLVAAIQQCRWLFADLLT